MTTHTIKAKRLSVAVGVTCDGCLSESEASLVLRANGDGVIAEMTMPKDWRSVILSKPEDGGDGGVTTNDLCPSCVGGAK